MFSDYIQTYCFAHGTYVHRSLKKGLVGVEAAAPGVGPGNAQDHFVFLAALPFLGSSYVGLSSKSSVEVHRRYQ